MCYPFTRPSNPETVCDIYDGTVVKNLMQPGHFLSVPEHTGLILSCDGAPVFKSSKSTLWPIYLTVTSIPPGERMRKENILVAGLWFGSVKPVMDLTLAPVLEKLKKLNCSGISVSTPLGVKIVRTKLLMGIFDLPAKATVTNTKQYNGQYGCLYCTDKGTRNNNTHVYLPNESHTLRTKAAFQQCAAEAEASGTPVCGVKGQSVLSKQIVLPQCVPIDYMHAVLEGVFKTLIKYWFDSSHHGSPYYLGRKVSLINKMVNRIKTPREINRCPRSVESYTIWKASEFRAWMLFYSLPVLCHFLPPEYIYHLALLVCAMHILLSDCIERSNLDDTEKIFYNISPLLYDNFICTYNMHSLIHISTVCKVVGPPMGVFHVWF